jgi:hypothetical protein
MDKYRPLTRYLAAVPADVAAITLTLSEIEAVLGAPLPRGAYAAGWWVGRARLQARTWLDAGWCVRAPTARTARPSITFARFGADGST